jgi:glycine hydroxymethyltransferase
MSLIQNNLLTNDQEIFDLIEKEHARQKTTLSMIPSENYTSKAVREALGSVLVHKYSEGQIGKRYYEGNQYIDQIETLAKERAAQAFNLPEDWRVNVQAVSGSIANFAVITALLEPGEKIMSMYLPDGGHLSHGWKLSNGTPISFSSKIFDVFLYKVDKETEVFDYDLLEKQAREFKPKLIITGGTAYPQQIDYKRMAKIAHDVNAYYLADIAHESGLVAAGANDSPVGIADVVTMTTHKTIRGPKGALILTHKNLIDKINSSVFPGLQGGPFNNNIAGIAVSLKESLTDEFKAYANQVVTNAKLLASILKDKGYHVVSGGTAKHLVLINLADKGIYGRNASRALAYAGIVCNRNTVPYETNSPMNPSGIRLGTPAITTRGMAEEEITVIAEWVDQVIKEVESLDLGKKTLDEADEILKGNQLFSTIKSKVENLCNKFPLE